jgi:hypothetical protein
MVDATVFATSLVLIYVNFLVISQQAWGRRVFVAEMFEGTLAAF